MKSTPHLATVLLGGALVVAAANQATAQDWPQWLGPNRDAKAASFTAPKTWPKELPQKWKLMVGDGVATPALVGDRLYVFSRQDSGEVTRCLDANTGKEIWQDRYDAMGATGPAERFSGPRCSPAVTEGKVVTLGVRGVLSCLDAAKGTVLWRKDEFKGSLPRFFTSSSPIIAGGLCVAQLGGQGNGGIVAYELGSGTEKWRWTGDGPAYASPVLMEIGGTRMIVAETDAKIVLLTLADGKLAWETPFVAQRMGYNAATPVVAGNTLIYCGSGRGATAVKIEKRGDVYEATELWKNPDNSVQFGTPVLKDGFLYGLTSGNDFFCLNVADGKTMWTALSTPTAAGAEVPPPGGGPGGPGGRGGRGGGGRGGYGNIVDAGSVLLALTPTSELIAFAPGGKAYTEVARIKVAPTPTHAYPIVSGKRIYIKDQDSVMLLALD